VRDALPCGSRLNGPTLLGGRRGFGGADLDFVADDADFVAVLPDFGAGVVEPGPFLDAEPPGVPGAGDRAVLNVTAGKRGPHVHADVVDGAVLAIDEKHRDHAVSHLIRPPFPFGNLPHLRHSLKFGHEFLRITDDPENRPAFIHCTAGIRVGAFWMIRRVLRDGWSIKDAEAEAEKVGLKDSPHLNEFARQYIEKYSKKK